MMMANPFTEGELRGLAMIAENAKRRIQIWRDCDRSIGGKREREQFKPEEDREWMGGAEFQISYRLGDRFGGAMVFYEAEVGRDENDRPTICFEAYSDQEGSDRLSLSDWHPGEDPGGLFGAWLQAIDQMILKLYKGEAR